MSEQSKFENHCIVELFGHQKIAGLVTEQLIAGQGFVRVDVPATKHHPAYTRLFGPSAIYSITPVTEEIAQAMQETIYAAPVTSYQIEAHTGRKEYEDDDE